MLVSQANKSITTKTKFSLEEVIAEKPEYLLERIRSEIPKKPLRNGSQIRINTLIHMCDLLEKNYKKLDNIESQLFEVKSKIYDLNSTHFTKNKKVVQFDG
jgi:hypothetical protein